MVTIRRDSGSIGAYAAALVVVPIVTHALLGPIGLAWIGAGLTAAIAIAGFLVWPTRAIVVLALWTLLIDTLELAAGPEVKYVDELMIPVLGVITLVRQRHRVAAAWWWPREIGAGVIIAAGISSSLLAGVPFAVWLPGLLLVAKGLAVFYIARWLDIDEDDVRWAMRAVLATGAVILAIGLIELIVPSAFVTIGLRPSAERAGLPAIKSIFYHPQLFGWFCGFVALYLFAGHAVMRRRWMLVGALLFSVGAILSARRRAILAVAAGLVSGLGISTVAARDGRAAELRRWLPSAAGLVIVTIAFLPALAGLYQLAVADYVPTEVPGPGLPGDPTDPFPEDPSEEAAGTPARIALYLTSLDIARDHVPFGAGLGRFGSWMSRTEYSSVYAAYDLDGIFGLSPQNPQYITDTFWPQVAGEMGVLGLVGYGLFVGSLAVGLLLAYRRRDPASALATVAILGAGMVLVQTMVESVASPIFNSPPQVYLIMIAIGGALSWQGRTVREAGGDLARHPTEDAPGRSGGDTAAERIGTTS